MHRSRKEAISGRLSLVIVAVLVGYQAYATYFSLSKIAGPDVPISHIVIIMQENRSFDNYFGTFPVADGIPANYRIPQNVFWLHNQPDYQLFIGLVKEAIMLS